MIVGSSSSLDACMEDFSLVVDDRRQGAAALDEQQASCADDCGTDPGEEQRGAGSERRDDDSTEQERAEFGPVARAVVRGECAAAHRLWSAFVDQRSEQHVLDAM